MQETVESKTTTSSLSTYDFQLSICNYAAA